MKNIIFLFLMIGLIQSCQSGKATKKEDSNVKEHAAKAVDELKMKTDTDSKVSAEELAQKTAERDKAKAELVAVRQNLKKMGMAAIFVPLTKGGNTFTYPGGRQVAIKERVNDPVVLQRLNDMMTEQVEKNNEDQHQMAACSGGYETCMDGRMYILYLAKSETACVREWYLAAENCQ